MSSTGSIFARVYAKLVSPRNTELVNLSGREWGALEGAFGTDGKEKSVEVLKEGASMNPIPTFTDTSEQHLGRYVDAYVQHVLGKGSSLMGGGSVDELYYLTSDGKTPRVAAGGGTLYLHRLGLITTHHDVNEALKKHIAKVAEAEAAAAEEAKAKKATGAAEEAKAKKAAGEAPTTEDPKQKGGGGGRVRKFFEGRIPRFDDSGNVCFVDAFDRVYYLDDDAVPFYFDDEFRTFRLDLSTVGVPRRKYVEQVAFSPRNPCHHQHREWEARFGPTTRLAGGAGPEEDETQEEAKDGAPKAVEELPKEEAKDGPPKAVEKLPPKPPPLPEAMMREDLAAVTRGALNPGQVEVVALRWRTLLREWLPKFLEQHPELNDTHFGTMLTNWRMKKSA